GVIGQFVAGVVERGGDGKTAHHAGRARRTAATGGNAVAVLQTGDVTRECRIVGPIGTRGIGGGDDQRCSGDAQGAVDEGNGVVTGGEAAGRDGIAAYVAARCGHCANV